MSEFEREREIREVARELLGELMPGILDQEMSAPNGAGSDHHGVAINGNGHHREGGNASRSAVSVARGRSDPVPQVPAPPVAAVLRPSTWDRPAAPGEIIGERRSENSTAAPAHPSIEGTSARPSETVRPFPRSPQAAGRPDPSVPSRAAVFSSLVASTVAAPTTPAAAPAGLEPGDIGTSGRVELVRIDDDEDLMQFVRQLIGRMGNPRDRLAIYTGKLNFKLRRRAGIGVADSAEAPAPARRIQRGAVTERVIREAANAGVRLVLAPGAVLTPLARERAQALGVAIERERK